MSKLIPYYHIVDIKEIERNFRVRGEVTKSNFLTTGLEYSIPCIDKPIVDGLVKEGNKLKITFFTKECDVQNSDDKIKFDAVGIRMEVWDDVSDCWDMVYEKFSDDG